MAGAALQRVLVDSWLRRGALAWLLAPIALVYGRLVAARRWLYRRQILQAHGVRVPVLVVGNVVAGGGGKTPLVLAIVRHLQQRGLTVGVVSRGYGRPGRHGLEVTGSSTAADVGDEPVLIHRSTGAFVHVAARRIDAARALLDNHPKLYECILPTTPGILPTNTTYWNDRGQSLASWQNNANVITTWEDNLQTLATWSYATRGYGNNVGRGTTFDSNSLLFTAPVDMYSSSSTTDFDKYLVFPRRNILE